MTADRYGGWTNYATWNVVLWIDNYVCAHARKNQWIRKSLGRVTARSVFICDKVSEISEAGVI